MVDTRIAYSAWCTWWGSIQKVGNRGGLPCCPVCGSVLFEVPSEVDWWKSVDKHEASGNPGYRAMVEWSRGKHFKNWQEAKTAYAALQG